MNMKLMTAQIAAQRTVLIAVLTALRGASPEGGDSIENLALRFGEALCDDALYQKHLETILLTARAIATGQPR